LSCIICNYLPPQLLLFDFRLVALLCLLYDHITVLVRMVRTLFSCHFLDWLKKFVAFCIPTYLLIIYTDPLPLTDKEGPAFKLLHRHSRSNPSICVWSCWATFCQRDKTRGGGDRLETMHKTKLRRGKYRLSYTRDTYTGEKVDARCGVTMMMISRILRGI
jgi:hypothetical protein